MKVSTDYLNESSLPDGSGIVNYSTLCRNLQRNHTFDDVFDSASAISFRDICLSLKNNLPYSVVRYMLSLNPRAAGVPAEGPTLLHMAVHYKCRLDVVELLVIACPPALAAEEPNTGMDPLAYAKRYRPNEAELIELLSRPLSYWMARKRCDEGHSRPTLGAPSPNFKRQFEDCNRHPLWNSDIRRPAFSAVDYSELRNLRYLCASLVKGQSHVHRELKTLGKKLSQKSKGEARETVMKQNQKFAYALAAMEQKDEEMISQIRWLERRLQKSIDQVLEAAHEIELNLQGTLDMMMSSFKTELRLMQGRLTIIEHDLAETGEKFEYSDFRGNTVQSRKRHFDRYPCKALPLTPLSTPTVSCSRLSRAYSDLDEVRSLLSDKKVVLRGKKLCKTCTVTSPLSRMAMPFKEGFFL